MGFGYARTGCALGVLILVTLAAPARALPVYVGCSAYSYLGANVTVYDLAHQYTAAHPAAPIAARDKPDSSASDCDTPFDANQL